MCSPHDYEHLGQEPSPTTGRSYHVVAQSADLAPYLARIAATREGQSNARTARVLHVERIETGRYEVVLAERSPARR